MLWSRNLKIRHVNTNKRFILLGYFVLDLFNIIWSIVGVSISFDFPTCVDDFGYLAYTGMILIVFGFLIIVRSLYLMTIFYFGKKLFEHMESKETQISQTEITFQCEKFDKLLSNN